MTTAELRWWHLAETITEQWLELEKAEKYGPSLIWLHLACACDSLALDEAHK